MEITKNLQSSVVRFLSYKNADNLFVPDFISGIQRKYEFWEVPRNFVEFNLETGAKFSTGRFGDTNISALQLYRNGIFAESHASTSSIDFFVDDLLSWVQSEFQIECLISEPVKRRYFSSTEVKTSIDFSSKFARLDKVSKMLSKMANDTGVAVATYEFSGLTINAEPNPRNVVQTGKFLFERRQGEKYEDNIFYSEAPVTSEQHKELLYELGRSL